MTSHGNAPELPEPYTLLATLAPGVFRVEAYGKPYVLRWSRGLDAHQNRHELAVLAAAQLDGVAGLVDQGLLADGSSFLVREWIEGRPLFEFAENASPEEVGACVVGLCKVLQALHDEGFVHADLKASNVIVRPNGEPVLCDFGLAVRDRSESVEVSGTFFAIAPEVLLGDPLRAGADLFALGVMLQQLFAPSSTTAQSPGCRNGQAGSAVKRAS